MLRFGYQPKFAVGVVAGSSVLGMLIPPSLLMILYGFLSNQSVGDLFTAGIVPGVLLALAYSALILALARWKPDMVFARELQAEADDEKARPEIGRVGPAAHAHAARRACLSSPGRGRAARLRFP